MNNKRKKLKINHYKIPILSPAEKNIGPWKLNALLTFYITMPIILFLKNYVTCFQTNIIKHKLENSHKII